MIAHQRNYRGKMSRILRKKPVTVKKRSRRPDDVPNQDGTAGAVSPPAVEGSREPVKKPVYVAKKAPPPPPEPGTIKGRIYQATQFLREVKVELKKVAWPSRQQTIGSTAVVLVLVMIIAVFLGAADIGLAGLIRVVLK